MDVVSKDGELLVAARRHGDGGMKCAQEETHAKFSLGVLQAPDNLAAEQAAAQK